MSRSSSRSIQSRRSGSRRRYVIVFAVTALVLLLVVAAVLCFILWPRKPKVHVTNVDLVGIDMETRPKFSLDVNLRLDLRIKNRNFMGFKYDRINMHILYKDDEIVKVDSAGGKIPGRRTVNATAGLNFGLKVVSNLLLDAVRGKELPLTVGTHFKGNVLLGILKPRIKVGVDCQVVINPREKQLVRWGCD